MKKNKTTNKKKYVLIAAVIVVLVGAAAAFFVYRDRQDNTEEEPASVVADPNFTGGTDREPGGSVDHQNGGVVPDDDTSEEPQGEPTTSPGGTISIYEPQQNQVLKPGGRLYGKTSFDEVWYRLIDDKVGVIAQGSMKAKNGAFSGSFDFNTTGAEGRLDVFYRDEDGLESDNVEINVKFK